MICNGLTTCYIKMIKCESGLPYFKIKGCRSSYATITVQNLRTVKKVKDFYFRSPWGYESRYN